MGGSFWLLYVPLFQCPVAFTKPEEAVFCEAGRSSICEAEEALFAKPGEAEMGIVLFLAPCYNIFIKFLCGRDFGQAEE